MSESGSSVSSGSGSDMDLAALRDPARLTFELLVDPHEVYPLLNIYEPLIGWIDPDLRLFHVGERGADIAASVKATNVTNNRAQKGARRGILVNKHRTDNDRRSFPVLPGTRMYGSDDETPFGRNGNGHAADGPEVVAMPPFSVILFLYEEEVTSGGRVDSARRCLSCAPWTLHHSEKAPRRNLNLNPRSLDYFFISEDLPLWSVRQVHYGKEHIRIVVQTRDDTWADMVDFYQLILGFEPDFLRDDFCLFTVHSQINFDIQFALKRADASTSARPSPVQQSARLQFKVMDLGRLVPLFPNVCQPVSDSCWLTTDHDGNEVILDVTGNGAAGSASSASDRASSESCASASSSDVSFDSHDSGNSQSSTCSLDSGGPAPRSTLHAFTRTSKSQTGSSNGSSSSSNNNSSCSINSNSSGSIGGENMNRKSQRRVTFCFDDVPPAASSPPASPVAPRRPLPPPPPARVSSRLKPVQPPRVPPSAAPLSSSSSPPESRFNLRFDTCPTAPLSRNNTREEQIGFYV